MRLVHRVLLDAGGDPRALGGAVTAALCGHWEHDGRCRWPHHTLDAALILAVPNSTQDLPSRNLPTVRYPSESGSTSTVRLMGEQAGRPQPQLLREEAEALATDPVDRAEARAIMLDMESVRTW